ncbi:MAG TPA: hypothetical protein VKV73_10910 [Chloroflexota bacterium]|nr:hypothetical protein [Chloroflexota bacterium]
MLPSNASEWETTNPSTKARGPRRAGGLVVMFGLLVLLIAVIAVAITRLPTGTLSRPAAAPSTAAAQPTAVVAAAAGVPVDAATEAAIQKVVEGLDNAQAQAIATNDQTVMASTAMPAFYAEEVQNNQDLVAGGVTEVKLLKLEWGDITTDGATATATVYETWSTTFSDGTTEQARDRNIYTLVQDNGAWKVQADVHPDTPTAATGP